MRPAAPLNNLFERKISDPLALNQRVREFETLTAHHLKSTAQAVFLRDGSDRHGPDFRRFRAENPPPILGFAAIVDMANPLRYRMIAHYRDMAGLAVRAPVGRGFEARPPTRFRWSKAC